MTKRALTGIAAVVAVAGLMLPAAASAQEAGRGFVGVLGGLTFGTVTSGAVAGQGGARIAPDLFVIGEVGYMRNVLPSELNDEFQDLIDLLEAEIGTPVDVEISAPATYGFGGVRWSPSRGALSPFIEGGVGFARIKLKVDQVEVFGVDFSDLLEDELGEDDSTTELLIAVGGGVNARLSPSINADFGYRYTRITTDDPAVNSSMLYAAVKVGF